MSNFLKKLKLKSIKKKPDKCAKKESADPPLLTELPTRQELVKQLTCEKFDVLIIGGGATGTGAALDAVSRGLKTALIEREDFASGTSSRSTKLVHGGVRYLQDAFLKFDSKQIKMVTEALHERKHILRIAPHLTKVLPILMPLYNPFQVPYMYGGLKLYDLVAGKEKLRMSTIHLQQRSREFLPTVNPKGLIAGVLFYDGQMNDSRLNIAIALSAIRRGATVVNHMSASKILKREKEDEDDCEPITINGVCATDRMTGDNIKIDAKVVINATGPHTDCVRKMDDRCVDDMVTLSAGVHIVLPGCLTDNKIGMLQPSSDGRVIFMLPWLNYTIVGTTDEKSELTFAPRAIQDEVEFLLREVNKYLHPDIKLTTKDVLASWSGIRPLVKDPKKKDTKSLSRSHVIEVSPTNLVTIVGGKWTTYRIMAKDAVDTAIKVGCLEPKYKATRTENLLLEGAHKWSPTMYFQLMNKYCFDCETARHLSEYYGDQAFHVAELALCGEVTKCGTKVYPKKLHRDFPYLEAEVLYGIKEYAATAVDVLARRMNISFLNAVAAFEVLPTVVDIMAKEFNWDDDEKKQHYEKGLRFLCKQMRFRKNEKPCSASDDSDS